MAGRACVLNLVLLYTCSTVQSSVVTQANGTFAANFTKENGTPETQCTAFENNGRNSSKEAFEQRDVRYQFSQSSVRSLLTHGRVSELHLDLTPTLTVMSDFRKALNNIHFLMIESRNKTEDWIAYVHEYFGNEKMATNLAKAYDSYPVVRRLLYDEFFWPWMCRYWADHYEETPLNVQRTPGTLPETLTRLVAFYVQAVSKEFKRNEESNDVNATCNEEYQPCMVFSSMQRALKNLPGIRTEVNVTTSGPELELDQAVLSVADAAALAELFPYMRCLRKLWLTNCLRSSAASGKVIDRLDDLEGLQELNLRGNTIGDMNIGKLMDKLSSLKDLENLHLKQTYITPVGGAVIAEKVGLLIGLKRLSLSYNELAASLSSLGRAFARMPKLRNTLAPVTCPNATLLPAVERQLKDMIHELRATVMSDSAKGNYDMYDGARSVRSQIRKWKAVKEMLSSDLNRSGVWITFENKSTMWVWIKTE
uniref:Uncharacterized protein n=1 Tax=Branchiostoma floridae TaxID=7739 RepID=C3Y6Q9_BRAFL|eukprot:XP_002608009.1 hypothetical protein BRAFLDRAFT_74961 [Branchiostoma floridae]